MKKFILLVVIILVSLYLFNGKEYDLVNDAIRFRVISNSNSEEDILMKEKVVNEVSSILFIKGNKDEIKSNIIKNIPVINEKISTLFNNNNYDKSYNVIYGMNEFPEKEYDNVVYSSGKYESLVIEIGEAKGNNYWCFLYPSLCMIDESKDDSHVVYESKLVNFIRDLFM